MKNKIFTISMAVLIFLFGTGYYNYKIIQENQKDKSYKSNLERKEMYPTDSLRYKYL